MEHPPSTYQASITLTYRQIREIHKAISARIVELTFRDYQYLRDDIETLLSVARILEAHEQIAVEEWEAQVAKREAQLLDDIEELDKFLNNETE